jgi:hypothetical protein
VRPFVNKETPEKAYRGLIEPYFTYCSPVLDMVLIQNWTRNLKSCKIGPTKQKLLKAAKVFTRRLPVLKDNFKFKFCFFLDFKC